MELLQGDCLEIMPTLPDASVDLVLCDLPYGVTDCSWDSVIPFDKLWEQYKRLLKPKGAVVLTSMQPFTTMLISSNLQWFRYCWIWMKSNCGNFANAKKQPLRTYEDICVFYPKQCTYNPQGTRPCKPRKKKTFRSETYRLGPTRRLQPNSHRLPEKHFDISQ